MKSLPKKIAVVGPESTGKSTLSAFLAKQFQCHWVPEYARYYCAKLSETCTWQDEINMFIGQLALEDAFLAHTNAPILICDTTVLTVKIWSDRMFGKTPQMVLDHLPLNKYDFYLLLDIDLPWEEDPLREFPNERNYFFDVWKKELDALNAKYEIVSGLGNVRQENALNHLNKFLKSNSIL